MTLVAHEDADTADRKTRLTAYGHIFAFQSAARYVLTFNIRVMLATFSSI